MKQARGLLTLAAGIFLAGCSTRHDMSNPDTLFLVADRSRDGLVSRNEFIGFAIAEAFARTDTQRDGFLTLEEFTAAGGTRGTYFAAARAGTTGVGVNAAQNTPALQQLMAAHFVRADTSRDNYLDKSEFVAHRANPPVGLR